MAEIQIAAISFEPQGLVVSYMEIPTDVRVEGRVVMQHQVQLSAAHPDYAEDAGALHARAVKVLKNALDDFRDSEPYEPDGDREDDDERGMGE